MSCLHYLGLDREWRPPNFCCGFKIINQTASGASELLYLGTYPDSNPRQCLLFQDKPGRSNIIVGGLLIVQGRCCKSVIIPGRCRTLCITPPESEMTPVTLPPPHVSCNVGSNQQSPHVIVILMLRGDLRSGNSETMKWGIHSIDTKYNYTFYKFSGI